MSEQQKPPGGTIFPVIMRTMGGQLTARRAAGIISLVTVVLTLAGGLLVKVADPDSFDNIGAGLWWAVQTLTTVGYGDVVPQSTGGKVIATIVMLNGIAFLTVITAAVTATLIDQVNQRRARGREVPAAGDQDVLTKLDEIGRRLDRIEAAIGAGRRDPPAG